MAGARHALLSNLSSGNGLLDMQQAIQASMGQSESQSRPGDLFDETQAKQDAELALALQETLLDADGFPLQDIALALQQSALAD